MTPANPGDAPRVLVLDDDERILSLRGSMLQQRGCEVSEVSNLEDALEALDTSPRFDLLVVDINLGSGPDDRRGIEFARFARDKYADLPIVGYSAVFREGDLTDEERSQFERTFAKGTARVEDLADFADWMVKLARYGRLGDAD